jgi:hemerythrin
MKDLVWDRTLSVDVPEIDEDHRRLVDLFNLLNHAVQEGESQAYVDAIMEELIACTVWHFKHEERLMLKHGYEGLAEHRTEHEDLIASVQALQQRLHDQGKPVLGDQIAFLEHWLTGHIFGADMKMGAYLGEMM